MKIRIALLFEFPTLNGGERSMLAAVDWLRANTNQFEFAAIAPSEGRLGNALRERMIPVTDWNLHPNGADRLSKDAAAVALSRIVTQQSTDILHANSLSMGRLTGYLSAQSGIKTTSHLRDIIKLSRAVISDLNLNQRLIAVSSATRDFHVKQGLESQRVTVIHNGIDLDQFQPRPRTGALEKELLLDANSLGSRKDQIQWIATIGQIGLRKGLDQLAKAAPLIVREVPDAHFLLIGERNSQKQESIEFEQSIRSQFDDAGLADRLHFLGHRSDVATLLNEIDLLVHPAHQEPLGRVLIEASASGIPIVATNVGGTSEIIEDGRTGLLVAPGNAEQLAHAAIKLLLDTRLAKSLAIAARERAELLFPISLAATRLADFWLDTHRHAKWRA